MPTEKELAEIREGITEAERAIDELEKEVSLAERAGVGVPEQREALTKLKSDVRKIKQVYG